MMFFKRHKQMFLNTFFGVLFLALLCVGVYAQAEPAERSVAAEPPVTDSEADTTAAKMAVASGRDAYADCYALQNLDLVEWTTNGIVEQEYLQNTAINAEGIAVALRLAGEETEVFAHPDDPDYLPPASAQYPDWAKAYLGYAVHENLVAADCDGNAPLQGAFYARLLETVLAKQGFVVSAADFSSYAESTLTYETMGEMTYAALTCTKEENGVSVSLADVLIEKGVLAEDAAILADLPVAGNTDAAYRTLFIQSLEEDSQPFLATEKNKALMTELMEDRTSHFALINREHLLAAEYVPALSGSGNTRMEPTAYAQLQQLLADAKKAGLFMQMRSGYRSYERQIQLYGQGENAYRSAPGTSEHQSGLAMDVVNAAGALDSSLANSAEARWLVENCWKYGFIIRYTEEKEAVTGYPAEWWHVRYVGKTLACELHRSGLAYEEFYAFCAGTTVTDPAVTNTAETSDSAAEPAQTTGAQ